MKKILIAFIFLISSAHSRENLYESLSLGEMDLGPYYGPVAPDLKRSKYSSKPIFLDDLIGQKYLENHTNNELFSLIEFIGQDLSFDSRCPNHQLEENLSYIRYLNRLIAISYLFENLKELWVDSYNLGFGNFCSINWDNTFGQCRATTIDMANFIKRAKGQFLKDFSKLRLKRMKKSERKVWLEKFRPLKKNLSVTEARINLFCKENGIDCKTIDYDTLKFAFQLSCAQDQYTLINICSGYDQLYGLSNVKNAHSLIVSSEAFKFIDEKGTGKECLKRFTQVYKSKEEASSVLPVIFPKVYKLMLDDKRVYRQGRIFISGSFKGFDAKGLEGFLFPKEIQKTQEMTDREVELAKNIEKIKKQIVGPVVEEKGYELKDPTSKNLNTLSFEIKNKSKGLNKAKNNTEPQFKKMEMKRFLIRADKVPLDMAEFKKDYVFTKNLDIETIKKAKAYSEKEILDKLKSSEGLGSLENPLSLIYLKYLIDFKIDTGLENILKLYKGRLYVLNDLIGPKKISYIELKNIDNGWQINILKQSKKSSKGPKFKTK